MLGLGLQNQLFHFSAEKMKRAKSKRSAHQTSAQNLTARLEVYTTILYRDLDMGSAYGRPRGESPGDDGAFQDLKNVIHLLLPQIVMKIFNYQCFINAVFLFSRNNIGCFGFKLNSLTSSTKLIRSFHYSPLMSAMDEVNAGSFCYLIYFLSNIFSLSYLLAAIAASQDPAINPAAPTFFDKLVSKEIPAAILYEDNLCMAFKDINPMGPVHFLVIPKEKDGLNRLSNAREDQKGLLGHLLFTAQKVAKDQGLKEGGFRTIINDGHNGNILLLLFTSD